jgi:hypothetical protein
MAFFREKMVDFTYIEFIFNYTFINLTIYYNLNIIYKYKIV